MADLHYREKLKSIEQAALSNNVPNKAKNIGMVFFTLASLLFISFLFFLTFSLYLNGILVGSVITLFVTIVFLYISIKIWTAPKYPNF